MSSDTIQIIIASALAVASLTGLWYYYHLISRKTH